MGCSSAQTSSKKGTRSRTCTFATFDSDNVEPGTSFGRSGAASIHTSDKPGVGNENPFVNGVVGRDSDKTVMKGHWNRR
jgi:hypothetical protein